MAEDRQIDAISIGIGANLTGLKDQLAAAQQVVSSFTFKAPQRAEIPFTVKVNTGDAERRLKTLTNPATPREIKIAATLIATQTSMAAFRKLMKEQIAQGGEFVIPFKADLKSAKAIKESIQGAINAAGPVTIQVAWEYGPGGPPPSGGTGGGGPTDTHGTRPKPSPKPAGPTGGNAVVTPTQPPQEPTAPAPRVITRAPRQRPVTAKSGGDPGTAKNLGGMRAARELREAQRTILPPTPGPTPAGTGGAPRPGQMPGVIPFDQRLQRGIARLMRTGDIDEFQALLGPYGASLGRSAKGFMFAPGTFLSGYNLPNRETGARDVNLAKLINEAMGFARAGRRPDAGPLREFEEMLPKEARFSPSTIDLAMRAGDLSQAFVARARGRAASTGGTFSDLDMHIANQRRAVLNSIQRQLHAEDPKAFMHAFGTGRGSVERLKNMGLGVLTSLSAARFGLKSIAPPSGVLRSGKNIVESFEETMKGSAAHNKALVASQRAFENAMKRAQGADREAARVVNPETGHVRGIPARGLPFVRAQGFDTVESFVKFMNNAAEEQEWFAAKKAGKFALGGKMRIARDFAGPPLPRENKEDLLFGLAHPRAKTDPAMANPLDNWAFRGLERDEAIEEMREHYASLVPPIRTRNALGGELGPLQRRLAAQKTEEQKRQEAKAAEEAKLPEWLRRARQGMGVAKDLTGRALGGKTGRFNIKHLLGLTREEYGTETSTDPGLSARGGRHPLFSWEGIWHRERPYPDQLPPWMPDLEDRTGLRRMRQQHEDDNPLTLGRLDVSNIDANRNQWAALSFSKNALGGKSRRQWGKSGAYIVGEQGDEIFVPESAGWIIPHRLMDQLPKRAGGGPTRPRPVPAEAGPFETPEERADRMKANMAADRAWQKENKESLPPLGEKESYRSRAHAYWKSLEEEENARLAAIEAAKAAAARKRRPVRAKAAGPTKISAEELVKSASTTEDMRSVLAQMLAGTSGGSAGGAGGGGGGMFEGADEGMPGKLPKYVPTAREEAQAYIKSVEEGQAVAIERAFIRSGMRERFAQLPQRAPGVAFGQLAAASYGGRGTAIERQQLSQQALTEAGGFRSRINRLTQERELQQNAIKQAKLDGASAEQLQKLQTNLEDTTGAITDLKDAERASLDTADAWGKQIGGFRQIFRVFSSNLTGVIGGTLLMSTAFGAVQTALGALSPVARNWIDEQTNLRSTSTRVTSALATQTQAQHGNVQAVLATTEAEAGLNKAAAEYITTSMRRTIQVKAGAAAQQQASDLFRATTGTGQGAPEGLFAGYGGLFGTPLLAQQLGGGKGFSEIIQGDLANLARTQQGPDLVGAIGNGLSYIANPDFARSIDTIAQQQGQPTPGIPGLALLDDFRKNIQGGIRNLFGFQEPATPESATAARDRMALDQNGPIQAYLRNLTENIAKVGGKAQFTYTADPGMRRLGEMAAAAAGDLNGVTAASQGFVVTLNGAVATTKDYTTAMEQAARGASLPSAAVVQQALARQREITQGTITAQLQHQLTTVLPQQAALNFYGNRPLTPGTGIVPPAGAQGFGGFSPVAPYTQQGFNQFRSYAQQSFDQISAYAAQGLTRLYDAGVPPELINRYKALGQSIYEIQTTLANEQAVASAVEYNHQLYITKRSLNDAYGLMGSLGTQQGHNLGALERENYLLGRQSTLLSLQLNQRQINFQMARAGFQAPGLTMEARAANIAEAKYEASIAQKQQNIGVAQYGVAGQIFDETARRQVNDLRFALADLQQQHKIEIDTKSAQQAIDLMTKDLSNVGDQIGSYLGKQEASFSAMISESATIAATATGEAFNKILMGVNVAWAQFQQIVTGGGYTPPRQPVSQGGKKTPLRAEGYIGTASVPTTVTYGDAGTEMVAVVRNPRTTMLTPSSGGGGTSFVFNFSVSGNADAAGAHALAEEVARIVEHKMNQRASLIMRSK